MLLPLRTFWMALALAICSLFLSSSMGTPAEDFQMASPLCRHFQGLEACQPGAAPEKRKSTYMRFGKRKSAYMRFGKRAMAEEPLAVAYEQNFEEPSAAMEKRKSAYMRFGKRKSAYMRFGRK